MAVTGDDDTGLSTPIQSFIKYFNRIKPYHTKILEVLEQYNFSDFDAVSSDDANNPTGAQLFMEMSEDVTMEFITPTHTVTPTVTQTPQVTVTPTATPVPIPVSFVTLDDVTLIATAELTISGNGGTLISSFADMTMVSSGTMTPAAGFNGGIVATFADMTSTGFGTMVPSANTSGAINVTLADMTLVAAGTMTPATPSIGSIAATLDPIGFTATADNVEPEPVPVLVPWGTGANTTISVLTTGADVQCGFSVESFGALDVGQWQKETGLAVDIAQGPWWDLPGGNIATEPLSRYQKFYVYTTIVLTDPGTTYIALESPLDTWLPMGGASHYKWGMEDSFSIGGRDTVWDTWMVYVETGDPAPTGQSPATVPNVVYMGRISGVIENGN